MIKSLPVLAALAVSLFVSACSFMTGGESADPNAHKDPGYYCYRAGKGYQAIQPLLVLAKSSPAIKSSVRQKISETNDAAIAAYDACTLAVANGQVVNIAEQTAKIRALATTIQNIFIAERNAAKVEGGKDTLVSEITVALIVVPLNARAVHEEVKLRLSDPTPISKSELDDLSTLLHNSL